MDKRMLLFLASVFDLILSAIILLIYFGLLPVDISYWGIPRWVIGLVGGVWFAGSLVVLVYQLTKTEPSEKFLPYDLSALVMEVSIDHAQIVTQLCDHQHQLDL